MLIGLDFDNTIVSYQRALKILADKHLALPEHLPRTKLALRSYLRDSGQESVWTMFQGTLYGPGMSYAEPFEGAVKVMHELVSVGHQLVIISHRSLRPYAGEAHDLHAAARHWVQAHLQSQGLFCGAVASNEVSFFESRDAKINHIANRSCQVFLDDLPEVLQATQFPSTTKGLLFDPSNEHQTTSLNRINSWHQLPQWLEKLG